MKFKDVYYEGRNSWSNFTLKRTNKRWSFMNTESGQRYFVKLGDNTNHVGGIQRFLEEIGATDNTTPKTKGNIDYNQFAMDVVAGKKANVHVKSGMFEKIKGTWIID